MSSIHFTQQVLDLYIAATHGDEHESEELWTHLLTEQVFPRPERVERVRPSLMSGELGTVGWRLGEPVGVPIFFCAAEDCYGETLGEMENQICIEVRNSIGGGCDLDGVLDGVWVVTTAGTRAKLWLFDTKCPDVLVPVFPLNITMDGMSYIDAKEDALTCQQWFAIMRENLLPSRAFIDGIWDSRINHLVVDLSTAIPLTNPTWPEEGMPESTVQYTLPNGDPIVLPFCDWYPALVQIRGEDQLQSCHQCCPRDDVGSWTRYWTFTVLP